LVVLTGVLASDVTEQRTPVTIAAAIPFIWMAVVALRESGLAWVFRHRAAPIFGALLLTAHFGWFETVSTETERRRVAAQDAGGTVSFEVFTPNNTVMSGMALHMPAWLAALPLVLLRNRFDSLLLLTAELTVVFFYWRLILTAILGGSSPRWFAHAAVVLAPLALIFAVFCFLTWVIPSHDVSTFTVGLSGLLVWWASRRTLKPQI
jgi:hypothetical protein